MRVATISSGSPDVQRLGAFFKLIFGYFKIKAYIRSMNHERKADYRLQEISF